MKPNTINIYISLFAGLCLILSSCSDVVDYKDGYDNQLTSYGPPTIERVTPVGDLETAISEAYLNQMICIVGDNLAEVQKILFNDVEVNLKTIYAVRGKITLPIPRVLPGEVNNTITVITAKGSTTHPLSVSIPPLTVEGFYNEFTHAGDTAQVLGTDFDLYEIAAEKAVIKLNGADVEVLNFEQNKFSVVIPEGVTGKAELTISTPRLTAPISLTLRDPGIQILNFAALDENGMWAGQDFLTDGSKAGDPDPLIGNFFRVKADYGAWAFTWLFGGGFNLNNQDVASNPQNYLVQFEMLTDRAKPFNDYENLKLQNLLWQRSSSINTLGKWRTIRLEATAVFEGANPGMGWNSFGISHQPQRDVSADFSICNFRFVKKK